MEKDIINTKDNRQRLYIYLSKQVGTVKAKALMKKHRNNLFGPKGLSYAVGRRSFEYFCLHYLQDTFVPKEGNSARILAPIHYEIWREIEEMYVHDSHDKSAIVVPRGIAKTTVGNFGTSVWTHCYGYSKYTIVGGKTEQDAIEFMREIRAAFEENEYIKHTFGDLVGDSKGTANRLELELSNRSKIQALGSKSSIRGKKYDGTRPTLILADDYQGKEDVRTQEARDKKYTDWQQDAKYAGDEPVYRDGEKIKMATKFIVLGTIIHRDCFISRIAKNKAYKTMMDKAIQVDDVDKLFSEGLWKEFKELYYNPRDRNAKENAMEFYYQNEEAMQFPVIWPDKLNCLKVALDYYEDPVAFKQEMQNDASKIGQRAFHQLKTFPRATIEEQEFEQTMLVCDPAVETNKHNDYTALLVGSKTFNEFRWVRRGEINRLSFEQYIKRVIELLKMYPDITHVWVEKNTYNGADVAEMEKRVLADPALTVRDIQFVNERQNKNKEAKIRARSAKVDSGFIIFAEEDTEFTGQILEYEGEGFSKHDDAPDAMAEFDRLIDELDIVPSIHILPRTALFG